MTKVPTRTEQNKNATKNFDFTTIADRLTTVSCNNENHLTGVVKPVYGILPSHYPQKLCNQKSRI